MERKKEKIMLLSLQRRQQQEETKVRKEVEAMKRREREQEKEDEKVRKKEEQLTRRAQILEHHRLKKAVEEAEREGKTLDRHTTDLLKQQQQQMATPPLRMRNNKVNRPRPQTIHVETNTAAMGLGGSSGKKGSNSNLTGNFRNFLFKFCCFLVALIFLSLISFCCIFFLLYQNCFCYQYSGIGLSSNTSTMRRDYYRGSSDSLSIKGRNFNCFYFLFFIPFWL